MKAKRFLVSMMLVFAMAVSTVAGTGKVSKAVESINVYQTDATSNSVTLSWTGSAAGYEVYARVSDQYVPVDPVMTNNGLTWKCKINGLSIGSSYTFYVFEAGEEYPSGYIYSAKTLPQKMGAPGITNYYDSIKVMYMAWSAPDAADGYQLRIEKKSGKKLFQTETTSNSIRLTSVYDGMVAKAKVRAYINVGTTKKYGAWSSYYYWGAPKSVKIGAKKGKIIVKGLKGTGITKKVIYVSKNSESGFKKTKTIGKKATKATIKKFGKKKLKKGTWYYVKVYYYFKVGSKTKKSPIVTSSNSVYIPMFS